MAFVYCENRWKDEKQNIEPFINSEQPSFLPLCLHKEKSIRSHKDFKNLIRGKQQKKQQQKEEELEFKELINKKMLKSEEEKIKKSKKGKICKSQTLNVKQVENNQQQLHDICKFLGKSSQSSSRIRQKNNWGNVRIKQILSVHHKKQDKNSLKQNFLKALFTDTQNLQKQHDLFSSKPEFLCISSQRKGGNRSLTKKSVDKSRVFNPSKLGEKQLLSQDNKKDLLVTANPIFKHLNDDSPSDMKNIVQNSSSSSYNFSTNFKKDETLATGIQEDSFEDSMEYIDDSTPGPGAYDIKSSIFKRPSTKIQNFGVTMDRFHVKRTTPFPANNIYPTYPQFKRTTKALQSRVGFGKSTKQQKDKQAQYQALFYSTPISIEQKSKKLKQKKKIDKIAFESCKERFSYNQQPGQQLLQLRPKQIVEQNEQQQIQQIPNSVFISKVKRQINVNTMFSNVDFKGQTINCLATKLQKDRQYEEDYELQRIPFLTNEVRFKQVVIKKQERQKQIRSIRRQQLKKREQEKIFRAIEKGYSFPKEDKKQQIIDAIKFPPPNKYFVQPAWIKQSFNVRFN